MTFVLMNNSRSVNKELAEQNYFKKYEEKDVRDGVEGDGQDLSEEDESQINEDVEGALDGHKELGHVQDGAPAEAVFHRSEQQQEGPFVCWERFLPLRSLKVLLVENDDSTRQVVGALLRNCGYEVTAVANGLQAWRILVDLTNHVDLVLTEVVMPCLSGVGLLSKIMNHKTCKNIPVIMMSSHDSMNIVFKCLSKGAVDFLVKPIRKNELKNLWQHIWRKCRSSSGSSSESGIQTRKSIKSKSCEESDNNTASNDEDDMESISLNARDGSDHGSGTQSSWTKRAVDFNSPKRMSSWDQVGDPPDSTCAQVIHSRPEAFSSNWVPVTANRDQDEELENDVMGKDLEIGAPRNPNLQIDEPSKKMPTEMAGTNDEDISNIDSKNDEESKTKQLELNSETVNKESYNQVTVQPGATTKGTDSLMESIVFNIPHGSSKVPEVKDKDRYNNEEMPCLELSLKRTRDVQHIECNAHDRNVLRHSDLSAFSRYNFAATPNQAPMGNVGSCSPADNSPKAAKTDSMQNFQSNSNSPPPNQGSNGSSNNNDMGSTTNNAVTKPPTISDKSAPKSVAKCHHPSSAFQPVQNASMIPPNVQGKADAAVANMIFTQVRGMNQHIQVQHHHHHHYYHLHPQHVQNMAKMQADRDDISLELSAAAPQCGSSNMLSAPGKCTAANHSLNGSASGSNYGSNGQNSSNPLNGQETNNNGDNKIDVKGGAMAGIGYGSTNGVDQSRNAQREASLHKFRLKRKDRCFEKKVRYHSRKKLAEQRPRIRGQFVRQVVGDNKGKEASQTTKP